MRTFFVVSFAAMALLSTASVSVAQRESVKTSSGDASETKVKPPAKTPGGDAYKKPKNGGPEAGGDKTAGAGTMATTDTEDSKQEKPSKDKPDGDKASAKTEGGKDAKGDPGKESKGDGGKGAGGGRRGGPAGDAEKGKPDEPVKTAYDFDLPAQDGKSLPLTGMKGKVLLIVNLGRLSSYNAQLAGLEKLSQTYKDKGLVVVGVPSNDFGKAEPGTPAEVSKAYADAKVDFVVTQCSSLTGVHQLPLYGYLAKDKSIQNNGISWNYTKFIVDRKGKVIVRFGPDVAPDSLELQATLQAVLDGTWKPKKEKPKRGEGGDDGDGPA